ncbi:hypothetical protein JG688_00017243 [Phytophthora aleatoria]|uniref:Uncharacterized protein n=1 Tax=Phytophthora aleatoria TaxID=2496075 RepID=A0A8J5M1G5_9STRA|nr:hypothetical protein JG688_00017243 [Phytophthora aleatoria]
MTSLLLVLTFVLALVFCASPCAQSYTFNRTVSSVPTATVAAANFTANETATVSNTTVVTFRSTVDEDSDDESEDSQDDNSTDSDSSDSYDDSDSSLSGFTFGNALNATSTIKSTYKNWGIGGIVDDLISSGTSSNGTLLTAGQYAYKIADKAATFYAVWDRTNIGGAISEFFQTICGPTEFVGEIDDGTAKDALGLKTVKAAFNNSAGNWTKNGDGSVIITFKSVDTEDVTVNIKSGGNKIDEVAVSAGKTVTWRSNVTVLGGKTLYLDRWRPGFLGLPGTGGGSLLLWVPRSTRGGNLRLTAMLNVS